MKTTLDEMIKTLTLTRLEIERFKASRKIAFADKGSSFAMNNFLQQITNALLDLQDKVTALMYEIEE